ncbi:MAG: chemotaxis protein CheW [Nitrospirota bacterium]|nr:chemotaxis protein CheW [Nitrospirota bacterium]
MSLQGSTLESTRNASAEVEHTQEFLTFGLGSEEFGIPILKVQEIIGFQRSTPIPNAPDWVLGVVNIRGVVIPVLDIRSIFGLGFREYDATSVIIVARIGEKVIGAAVDRVNDVLAFTDGQIQATPEVSERVDTHYLTGVGKMDERMVLLLDIEQVLGGSIHGVAV